ncbi:MAG: GNAT family N-acetyltransferase [Bryobacteraceae bacterium]|nr:GNAT family N-acetyltransferase [Bryobacteraceae bacterium]
MQDDVRESDSQFRSAWRQFALGLPNGREAELPGIRAVFAGIPVSFFNVLFVEAGLKDAKDLQGRVEAGMRWADEQGVPWLLCARDDEVGRVAGTAALEAKGLHAAMPITGMIADELTAPAGTDAPLEFRRVDDADTRRAIVDLNAAAYGMSLGGGGELASPRLWDERAFGVLAYLDGKPVSCSATFLVDGRLYVGWVATLPEQRRRGYAERAMRRSLEGAARVHGWQRSVLHATPLGRPVYEKMGYRAAAEYTMYSLAH